MYSIIVKNKERLFSVNMSGFMTETESRAYIEEFKKKIKSINPSEYNIVVDTHDLKTASKDLLGLMCEAQELIINTPFKARYSIMPKSAVAVSQLKRVGKEDHVFDSTIFVQSYEEVLKMIS